MSKYSGVAEMSISSVLSGSGVGRPQWVQLLHMVDRAVTGAGMGTGVEGEEQQLAAQNKVGGIVAICHTVMVVIA